MPGEAMMDRRGFLGTGLAAGGLAAAASLAGKASALDLDGLTLYELRRYSLKAGERQAQFIAYVKNAVAPTLDEIGVRPLGVFEPLAPTPEPFVYVLLAHTVPETVITSAFLMESEAYRKAAAPYFDLPAGDPLYLRMDSTVLVAFTEFPRLEAPDVTKPRVFQLRTYESPNERAAAKKIEMFNTAEIAIFRKVGIKPVFFGQQLTGSGMPCLTYMVTAPDEAALKAEWSKFGADPDWLKLKAAPGYADREIVSKIHATMLKPADCSQI
jgi:hypothetical protein